MINIKYLIKNAIEKGKNVNVCSNCKVCSKGKLTTRYGSNKLCFECRIEGNLGYNPSRQYNAQTYFNKKFKPLIK